MRLDCCDSLRARWLTFALLCLATGLAACGPAEPGADFVPPPIPDPPLDTVEALVAEALRSDRAAVVEAPKRASAWGRYGQTLHAHDLRQEAAVCYRAAAELAPLEVRWPYLEGRALQPLDLEASLAAFDRAVALRPRESAVYLAQGEARLEAGAPREAQISFRTTLDRGGNDAFAHFGLARAHLLEGALDAAREAAEEAVTRRTDLTVAHTLLAQIAQRQGDDAVAQRHLWIASNRTGSPPPDDPILSAMNDRGVSAVWWRRRGLSALTRESSEEAEAAIRQVLAIQPTSAADHAHLGAALIQQGKIEAARQVYEDGLKLAGRSASLHNNLAQLLLQSGELAEAETQLSLALELAPNDLEARLNRALLDLHRGDLDAGSAGLEAALELAPGDTRVLGQLAPLLAQTGNHERAIALWERLLDVAPEQLDALEPLARLLSRRGDNAEAIRWLRHGLSVAPNSSRLNLLLAWELSTASDPALRNGAEATRLARRVRTAYPDNPQGADVLAAALAASGDFEGAVAEAQAALTLAAGQGLDTRQLQRRLELYRAGQPHHRPAR